ncbi:unnamed protein product [Nesidiocoris tenuis]|uniref:Spore coat protein U/FanG domain-containing protein n=1 Tax=Nesidiocoris tenuis TaxID=355587 RepID=A0A6H5HR73_9HEMI|nr:unnamed protein product [Nesidiocoris tenuis]
MLFAGYSFAWSASWQYVCDFNWNNETVDFTNGGSISPLELTSQSQQYQEPVEVWCLSIPNDTSTSGQHVGLEVTNQDPNQGSDAPLAMRTSNTQQSGNSLPFYLCLGKEETDHLCVSQVNDKRTYDWGYSPKDPSIAPDIFQLVSKDDPADPCNDGSGKAQWCADGFMISKGPFNNIAYIHIKTKPGIIRGAPPAPGIYQDIVTATLNGNLGTNMSLPEPSTVDITKETTATMTLEATLRPDCRIDSAPDVPMKGSFSSQLSQQQQIGVTCTNTTPYSMSFAGANDITGWHQMKSETNSDMLRYQIYSNSTHTALWNNTQSFIGSGLQQNHDIYYATDPSQANLPAGTYQDTETLTVSY